MECTNVVRYIRDFVSELIAALTMTRRLILLIIALLGAALWVAQLPSEIQVGPLPGQNLKVRLGVEVRFGGDYFVEVSMPKVGSAVALEPFDFIKCDLSLVIAKAGTEVQSQHIESMNRATEFGWANTQQYVGGPAFHLNHGMYDATISNGGGCPAAAARGASVTIARQYREHILRSLLLHLVTWALILVGVVGLVILDLKRGPR
jgi:hypothetical protein